MGSSGSPGASVAGNGGANLDGIFVRGGGVPTQLESDRTPIGTCASLGDRVGGVVQQVVDGFIDRVLGAFERFVGQLFGTPSFAQPAPFSGADSSSLYPNEKDLRIGAAGISAGPTIEIRPSAENPGLLLSATDSGMFTVGSQLTGSTPAGGVTSGSFGGCLPWASSSGSAGGGQPPLQPSSGGILVAGLNGISQLLSQFDPTALLRDTAAALSSGIEWVKENAETILSTVAGFLPYGKMRGAIGSGLKQLKKLL